MVSIIGLSREKVIALVDVGSGGARAALLSCPASGPCRVLAHASSALSFEERAPAQAAAALSADVKDAAARALDLYKGAGLRSPIEDVYAIVHAPWVHSKTSSVTRNFPDDIPIKDALIADMAHSALSADAPKGRLIEASVIRVALNGYVTHVPAGKHAHQVDVSAIMSVCDEGAYAAIASALQQSFPAASIQWRSSVRAELTVARNMRDVLIDCFIVEMGIDSTDLIAIHNGVVTEESTVPEGARAILSRVAGKQAPEATLSLLRMLARDACEGNSCDALQGAIAAAEPELAKVFGEAIGELAAERRVGNDLVLIAHPDLTDWFSRFFSRIDFAQFTLTTLPFTVYVPSADDMRQWITGAENMDNALCIGAALVNIETGS